MPLPQLDFLHALPRSGHSAPGSIWQVLEQPSPLAELPSSQVSPPRRRPSPQRGVQRLPGTRHSHPASTARQSAEQPSPLDVLPSSQTSSADSAPFPQPGEPWQAPLMARHKPPEQQPLAQVSPAQQTSPSPPQRAQTVAAPLVVQAVPAWQLGLPVPVAQQLSPACPQAPQMLPLHANPP